LRGFLVILFCLSLATSALAGPWLREEGTTFTSTSFTLNYFYETGSNTYVEHGLRDDMTVGADIGIFRNSTIGPSGTATLFLRRPFGNREGKNLWAYDLGLGASWEGLLISPHVKTALTWGRGITLRGKGGWTTVDASIIWDFGYAAHLVKIDGTVGLNISDRFASMFQLYVSHSKGDTAAIVAPSLIYTPAKGKSKWQIGLENPIGDSRRTAIKFGLWREF